MKTKSKETTNDVRKVVSFQPQVPERTKSYAEAVKSKNTELGAVGKRYPLIDFYPKVK